MGLNIPMLTKPTVCIAGGPSLTLAQVRHIGMAHAAGRCHVIAVNDAVYPCWFADICFAADSDWWVVHNSVPGFHGSRASIRHDRKKHPAGDIALYDWDRSEGFSEKPGALTSGGNSGYSAVHLAATLGATEIILVAYDFIGDAKGDVVDHWFGEHKGRLRPTHHGHENARLVSFKTLTDDLMKRHVYLRNASLRSAINWLPRFDVEALSRGIADA